MIDCDRGKVLNFLLKEEDDFFLLLFFPDKGKRWFFNEFSVFLKLSVDRFSYYLLEQNSLHKRFGGITCWRRLLLGGTGR